MSKSKKTLRIILARNVIYLRHEHKWSQEELASRSKMSTTYISDIENCKSNTGIDYIDNLAYAFNINAFELLVDHGWIVAKKRVDSKL